MYPDSKSRSQQLYDRALKSLPGGNSRVFMKPHPVYAARGEGCRVFDVDGNEYIDCINNFTSLIGIDRPCGVRRLDMIGAAVRAGIDEAFRRHGVPGGTVGLGSLLKIHFADRPIRDYRSAYMTEQEVLRQAIFNRGLLNRGVLAAGYGLMALSTPMTDADIDMVIAAASDALEEVSASA